MKGTTMGALQPNHGKMQQHMFNWHSFGKGVRMSKAVVAFFFGVERFKIWKFKTFSERID